LPWAVTSRKYGNFALSYVEACVLNNQFDWKLEINKICNIRFHLDSVMWPKHDNLTPLLPAPKKSIQMLVDEHCMPFCTRDESGNI